MKVFIVFKSEMELKEGENVKELLEDVLDGTLILDAPDVTQIEDETGKVLVKDE